MRVLVTGAGGFLGRYIVEQLVRRGDEVRGLARGDYPELAAAGVEMVRGDVRDPAAVARACEQVDAVIHTAAVAGIWGPREQFFSINTEGAKRVIEQAQAAGARALVYCSSPSVTFDANPQENIDESAPYPQRWLCHYPHSKALGEQAALGANRVGFRTCSLRPHLIWGPRDQHLIPRLLDRARSGQLRIVGDGRNLIDMVYVENAADAHVRALDELLGAGRAAGNAYFISQGEPVECWTWINEILALAGLPPLTRRISFRKAWAAGHVLEWIWRCLGRTDEPRMTRFLAAQLALPHYFDISAARRDFGYRPRVSAAEGMERLKKWLAEQQDSIQEGANDRPMRQGDGNKE